MADVIRNGVRVTAVRKRRRGCMAARVEGRWLGVVDKIEGGPRTFGWVTIRVPLANVSLVDEADIPDEEA